MAKGNKNSKDKSGPVENVKAKRAKTPAQQAKVAANIALAQKRLAELQAAQRAGFKSVDEHRQHIANTAASDWLARVFNVRGHGTLIRRWLAGRINQPATQVKALVQSFLARERNATIAQEVVDEGFNGFKEELAA